MNKITLNLDIYGDSYEEIIEKAEVEINDFLGVEDQSIDEMASYEVIVSKDVDMQADFEYKANIIAKVKYDPR